MQRDNTITRKYLIEQVRKADSQRNTIIEYGDISLFQKPRSKVIRKTHTLH